MFKSSSIYFLIAMLIYSVNGFSSQEIITGEGVGVADTKYKACEKAMDFARREAAQAATTIVESQFESMQTSKGLTTKNDLVITSKAFAKLVEKQSEEVIFDPNTGLINCKVTASFKAGFVTESTENDQDIKKTEIINHNVRKTTETSAEFRAGEPWCSQLLLMCFRELYSKQLNKFGLQIVPVSGGRKFHDASNYKLGDLIVGIKMRDSFSDIKETYNKGGSQFVKVETIDRLKQIIKQHSDSLPQIMRLQLKTDSHKWDEKGGQYRVSVMPQFSNKSSSSGYLHEATKKPIFKKIKPDKKSIKKLDEIMTKALEDYEAGEYL